MPSSNTNYFLHDQEIKRLQMSIAFVTSILSSFGIFLTIIFFIFNIRYRNFRLIKMSSPNINNIINFSCVLLYICPILNSIKAIFIQNELLANLMCQLNTWFLPISSTAIYAAMLAKAWRIYKIFDTSPKMKKVVIKDLRLVCYISFLILVDIVILGIWQFVDPVKLRPRYVYELHTQVSQIILPSSYSSKYAMLSTTASPVANRSSGHDAPAFESYNLEANLNDAKGNYPIIQNYSHTNQLKIVFECNSNLNEVWITILTMYKIILLMYGIYLAWLIRNVNVPSMNDSKYLFLSTYTIIVCGLGSMTLMHLLRDWPDVVQAFFTIGVILATCTTQCLLFIPKIRLWYKRRNDDNFKISLSQIFLQTTSSSCYFSDGKPNRKSANAANSNLINLEDELCELLHENSQLKNFLKEKEEIIKLLQEKIKVTKATLLQVNKEQQTQHNKILISASTTTTTCKYKTDTNSKVQGDGLIFEPMVAPDLNSANEANDLNKSNLHEKSANDVSCYDVDLSDSTVTTTAETIKSSFKKQNTQANDYSDKMQFSMTNTEQLKNDLDEVEELTSRVRDSISVDLSNTRRYSPLLYEYYRKQLELAKSIQCTYNIQCNSLFDAMTLMRNCLKDYCQTVHNPEYLAIETLNNNSTLSNKFSPNCASSNSQFTFTDYINKNNLKQMSYNNANMLYTLSNNDNRGNPNAIITNKYFQFNPAFNQSIKNNSLSSNNGRNNLKKVLLNSNPFETPEEDETETTNNHQNNLDINFSSPLSYSQKFSTSSENATGVASNESSTATTSTGSSCSLAASNFSNTNNINNSNMNAVTNGKFSSTPSASIVANLINQAISTAATIDNKQTYV